MRQVCPLARQVAKEGNVGAPEIAGLRRAIYRDGVVSREEADALFAIERARTGHCDTWSDLFVEAITDYALNQEPPTGYLSEDTATWLMGEISQHGKPSTDAQIELVTNIIEKAREVPASFSAFSLRLVKNMVICRGGPDARRRPHVGGRVSEADTITLQRILWAAGSEGQMAISREEAEALFAIAHASDGAENDPKFDDLFAKMVGNYLLGATGRSVPPRDVSLRCAADTSNRIDVLKMLTQMLADASQATDTHFLIATIRKARCLGEDVDPALNNENSKPDAAMTSASALSPEKAQWLLQQFDAKGTTTEPEKALVRFIAREAGSIDRSLMPLVSRAKASSHGSPRRAGGGLGQFWPKR